MQIIKSYSTAGSLSRTHRLRMFHGERPSVLLWRKTRFGLPFPLDPVDIWLQNNISNKNITVVDFGGWYLENFGFKTTCIESDYVAKHYYNDCYIEPNIASYRPNYVVESNPVILRRPACLKYKSLDDFVQFLDVWTKSLLILHFEPKTILHNHLKFKLSDLVKDRTNLHIQEVHQDLWQVSNKPCKKQD